MNAVVRTWRHEPGWMPAIAAALVALSLSATAAMLAAPSASATRFLALTVGSTVVVAMIASAAVISPVIVTAAMILAGGLTLDVAPLAVFRYLLLSDVLLVLAGLIAWRSGASLRVPVLVTVCFLIYLTNGLLSFVRSGAPEAGLFTWLHSAFVMLVYVPLVTTGLASKRYLPTLAFVGVIVSGVVQALLVDAAVAGGLHWQTGTRIRGAFGNPSLWVMAIAVIGAALVVIQERGRARALAAGGIAVVIPAAVFTRSRSIWVGMIIGVTLALIITTRRRLLGALAACALVALLVGSYTLGLYPEAVQTRIAQTLTVRTSQDLVGRTEVVGRMWPFVASSPLLGVGINESHRYLPERLVVGNIASVHNVIMHAAVEIGVIAAAALLALPIAATALWRRARAMSADDPERRRLADWSFISFTALYVGVQFTPAMYEHVAYFLLAFLASLSQQTPDAGESHPLPHAARS
jgi:O-antigen ligase